MENPLQKENRYTTRLRWHLTPITTHLPKETTTNVRWLIAPPNFMPVLNINDMVWTPHLVKSFQQDDLISLFPLNLLKCMLLDSNLL